MMVPVRIKSLEVVAVVETVSGFRREVIARLPGGSDAEWTADLQRGTVQIGTLPDGTTPVLAYDGSGALTLVCAWEHDPAARISVATPDGELVPTAPGQVANRCQGCAVVDPITAAPVTLATAPRSLSEVQAPRTRSTVDPRDAALLGTVASPADVAAVLEDSAA